jgi:putative membrane protein
MLATISACWNTAAAVLMGLGFRAIKQKRREAHRRFMLAAFCASCLFLTSYLARIAVYGDQHFEGVGPIRVFYLVLLATHVLLAMIVAPLVITTLTLGLRQRVDRHRKLARFTLPVWAYVSVTGVIVYVMLYHLR